MTDAALAATGAHRAWPSLVENKPLRFAAVMVLYFMQGVPLGLSLVALPAWFVAAGASAVEVGAFVGFAALPWSLKPFTGLLMDRFAYRPMGRRRAWILIAQGCMVAALLALAIAAPDASQIALIGGFCFALNLCATFNDVAVDGMTIDLVPMEERGAINGCMYGSQWVGVAVTSFAAGQLLVGGGTATTALLLACVVAVPSLIVAFLRERPGERLMPWTSGKPSAECEALQHDAWWPVIRGVLTSLADRYIIVYLLAFTMAVSTFALTDTAGPIAGVQQLGWGSDEYSTFSSIINLTAGLTAMALSGLLIKWIGLSRMVVLVGLFLVVISVIGGLTQESWAENGLFPVILAAQ
ncbi:MAG: MFS transporter, partial [Pacificimonas sp.]|nr:MFS transporter [Pacificimonas sp.]